MRIHCTTTFLDGATRFEKDDICTVPDGDAQRFIGAGWAVEYAQADAAAAAPADLSPANTPLVVQDVHIATSSEFKG